MQISLTKQSVLLMLASAVLVFIIIFLITYPQTYRPLTEPSTLIKIKDVCWNGNIPGQTEFDCTDKECTIFAGDKQYYGSFETVNFKGKTIDIFTCTSPEGKIYKAATDEGIIIDKSTYTTIFGKITKTKDAYYAFILLKHPEQIKDILTNPEAIEVHTAFDEPEHIFQKNKETILQKSDCNVYLPNFTFYGYPKITEQDGYFIIKRVYHYGLNYFFEEARLYPDGKIDRYISNKIMGCED